MDIPEPGDDRQARSLRGRLGQLAGVTTELLAAEDVADVTRIVTEDLAVAAGATIGSLSVLVDDDTLALAGIRGGRAGVERRWATYPVSEATPAGDAVRSGRTVVVDSDEMPERYPDLADEITGERRIVCVPLRVRGRSIGAMTLSFPGRPVIDAEELQFLGIMADNCAQTISRIRADEVAAERQARARFLAEASAELLGNLDYEATLRRVAALVVPEFADWCAIALEQDGVLRTLEVAHVRPESEPLIEELQTRYAPDPASDQGGYAVLRTGRSQLVSEIPQLLLEQAAVDERHLELLRALNFRSGLAVPLKVQDRVLGVITWVTGEGGRRFDAEDLRFAEDLAGRAALAIDNAHLHSEVRDVALRLQRAVLPDRLPVEDGWETAVQYLPAGRSGAGGDFYDVLPLSGGRMGVFVGDVMGRGVQAASVMAQMRSAVRTLLAIDPEPEAVMAGLDRVFESWHVEQLVSVVYALADPQLGVVRIINAGHPSPLLLAADGSADHVVSSSTLILGVGGGERSVVTRFFEVGDTLLLYTDGLVERRGEDLDAGDARLLDAADCLAGDLDAGLDELVKRLRDPSRDDDVAVLALRRTPSAVVPVDGVVDTPAFVAGVGS